jgi:hypothetical protein
MIAPTPDLGDLNVETQRFYRHAVQLLKRSDVPFLVGGAYALAHYTGIVRHTKDFDLFVRPPDIHAALRAFAAANYRTEFTFTHWLGKAFHAEDFIDLIFSSGNGIAKVDDAWFRHARPASLFGEAVRLCPPEETIWSKSFVCERERFDGADINHLILTCGANFDWQRLLDRFGPHWRILLTHLVMFGFAYPSERSAVPHGVIDLLSRRLLEENAQTPPPRRVCQGTLLSRTQYVIDLDDWGFVDARLGGEAGMSTVQADDWTRAGLLQDK